MTARALPPALLLLSPGELDGVGTEAFADLVAVLARAGLRGLLLREPGLCDRAFLALARSLRSALPRAQGGWLGVHDRAHLAEACDADAVHLGWRSLAPRELRGWLPDDLALGLSTHAGDDRARWSGADYRLHAPLFAVPGKGAPVAAQGLARAVAAAGPPVWALGGITPERVSAALAAGARGVGVQRGVFAAPDPGQALAAYLRATTSAAGRC